MSGHVRSKGSPRGRGNGSVTIIRVREATLDEALKMLFKGRKRKSPTKRVVKMPEFSFTK